MENLASTTATRANQALLDGDAKAAAAGIAKPCGQIRTMPRPTTTWH